jgi:hypothetical protein
MAPRTAWITSPTPGAWTSVAIPRDTVVIQFKNDGPYDYFLHFGGTSAPDYTPSTTTLAQGTVFAGEYPVLPIQSRGASPSEQRYNTIGDFDGNLWYYGMDNTGGLAQTGASSTRNLIAVVCYGPLDPSPTSGAVRPIWHDLASQPRMIMVPFAHELSYGAVGQISATATGRQAIAETAVPATSTAQGGYMGYLYWVHAKPSRNVVSSGQVQINIELDVLNGGGVSIGGPYPVALATTFLHWGTDGRTEPWDFYPPQPVCYPGAIGTNSGWTIGLYIRVVSTTGSVAAQVIGYTATVSVDTSNEVLSNPGPIGVYASPSNVRY